MVAMATEHRAIVKWDGSSIDVGLGKGLCALKGGTPQNIPSYGLNTVEQFGSNSRQFFDSISSNVHVLDLFQLALI